jgi:hypothetical protein
MFKKLFKSKPSKVLTASNISLPNHRTLKITPGSSKSLYSSILNSGYYGPSYGPRIKPGYQRPYNQLTEKYNTLKTANTNAIKKIENAKQAKIDYVKKSFSYDWKTDDFSNRTGKKMTMSEYVNATGDMSYFGGGGARKTHKQHKSNKSRKLSKRNVKSKSRKNRK